MKIERYPAYKDSGIEWLGEVPDHWSIARNKKIFKERNSLSTTGKETLLTVSHITGVTPRSEKNVNMFMAETMEGYKICHQGDLIINTMWAWMGALGTSNELGICSPSYNVYMPIKGIQYNHRYFDYLFRIPNAIVEMASNSKGIVSSRLRLYPKEFLQIETVLPSLEEQEAIANYLDTKTAQIDRKIDLLTEKAKLYNNLKQSLINETVTRGLDKTLPMKDSGVEWLGEVPEHWEIELVKRSLKVLTDYTANGSFASLAENVSYMDSGYARLVRLTDLRHDLKNDGIYVDEKAYNFLSKTKLHGGEILIANVGAYTGLVKLVPQINFKATLGPNMFLATFSKKLLHSFINYQLSSICCFEQFRVQMTTTAQPKLNKDNFRLISIVIPPLSEQKNIADYLDTKTAQIDKIIQTINTQIEKLKELRKTLINDVVTGKIKVV